MVSFVTLAVWGIIAADQVAALGLFQLLSRNSPTPAVRLVARDNIPPACISTTGCQTYTSITNSCSVPACTCTQSLAESLTACANCIVSQPGVTASDRQNQQAILDTITNECQADGLPFTSPLELSSGSGALSLTPGKTLAAFGVVGAFMAAQI